MSRIELFKPEDWHLDNPIEEIEAPDEVLQNINTVGLAFSAFDGDKCIGCGGLIYWKEDEGEAWMRLDKCVFEHPGKYVKVIMGIAHMCLELFDGYIYCWVDESQPKYQRLVQWFGYKKRQELRIKNGNEYRMWEFDRGTNIYDRRNYRKRGRSNAASKHGQATSGSSSKNK